MLLLVLCVNRVTAHYLHFVFIQSTETELHLAKSLWLLSTTLFWVYSACAVINHGHESCVLQKSALSRQCYLLPLNLTLLHVAFSTLLMTFGHHFSAAPNSASANSAYSVSPPELTDDAQGIKQLY